MITVHIAEAMTRHAVPLCKGSSRATTYKRMPDEAVWILARAKPPSRVQLGGTGFTVPVDMIESVEAQRGRACVPCPDCLKKLSAMSGRLEAAQ